MGLPLALAALAGAPVDNACSAALAEIARAAAARGWEAEARCVGRMNTRLPPSSALTAEPLPADGAWRSGPVTWVVRSDEPGRASHSQRVPMRVTWIAPAWIATRSLAAGQSLPPDGTRKAMHRWPDGALVNAAEGSPPQGRLMRAVREGDALQANALMPPDGLLRGDRLEAVLAAGGIEIRTPVTLLAHARVGDRVRVQPVGRAEALDGTLTDRTTVRVEGP